MNLSDDNNKNSDITYGEDELSEISNKGLNDVSLQQRYQKQKSTLFRFVLWFTSIWSFLVVVLLYAKSFNLWNCSLSDCVLCTLLTTTFGTVIGLPLIAASHFFPKNRK